MKLTLICGHYCFLKRFFSSFSSFILVLWRLFQISCIKKNSYGDFLKRPENLIKCCFVIIIKNYHRCRCLKGIHSRSDTNRTGAEGLSFYYPRLLHYLDQMLAVMSLSQHRVSSSKTIRPHAPCGA